MFTGIVEELGTVRAVDAVGDGRRLVVAAETVLDDVTLGASVAVNGCCLTVVEWGDEWFAVDAVPETIERTTIGDLWRSVTRSTSSVHWPLTDVSGVMLSRATLIPSPRCWPWSTSPTALAG
ncbi:MAG: hypothetical protein Ct9H300mP12_17110 [Acidimicrobiales bacterium]|nr:MAG: hypothetical protein Ct9H300mP12_17110 [Acidimicrobiales bacterium]